MNKITSVISDKLKNDENNENNNSLKNNENNNSLKNNENNNSLKNDDNKEKNNNSLKNISIRSGIGPVTDGFVNSFISKFKENIEKEKIIENSIKVIEDKFYPFIGFCFVLYLINILLTFAILMKLINKK